MLVTSCIPQPGTSAKLDPISDRQMYRAVYRNFGSYQTLIGNHTVDADGADQAGIHWFELRNSGSGWGTVPYQEGVYAPADGDNRWMGSLAMDGAGDMALGYSVSSSTTYPSVRYTGRLATDTLGLMPQGEVNLATGGGSQTDPSSRWGDYSTMSVDPTDDCTFWYTQEYYSVTSGAAWNTIIGSFKFPSCSVFGDALITSDQPVVAAARSYIGSQVTAHNGFDVGSTTSNVPMLFKNQFGGFYSSALYIENADPANTANVTMNFYDVYGSFTCTITTALPKLSDESIWLPGLGCLGTVWSGGVNVTSDRPIMAIGRTHVYNEIMAYDGFASGSTTMYVPMLFKHQFGNYDSALYVQNMSATSVAHISVAFYDVYGNYNCTMNDTLQVLAATGYWVGNRECLPDPWSGGVVITSDQPIIALGRPHIADQVTAYDGFASGSTTTYVPMLKKNVAGVGGALPFRRFMSKTPAQLRRLTLPCSSMMISGNLSCTLTDTLPALASTGYWIPNRDCLPAVWSGSMVITSDQPMIAVGRLHVGGEIMTYDGSAGATAPNVPILFRDPFATDTYNSALVVQNTNDALNANVTVKLYDTAGDLICTKNVLLGPLTALDYWLSGLACP